MKTKCAAIQMSDQMVCSQCQLSWDMNDDDIPVCQPKRGDGSLMNRVEPTISGGVITKVDMVRDMTLRDHFAAVALAGSEEDYTTHMSYKERAEHCYKMADAMMEQRLK